MTWTLCTSGSAVRKAGVNADTNLTTSGSFLAQLSDETEGLICSIARSDVVGNFGTLTANGKEILGQLCSDVIGQEIISNNMEGYTSRFESTMMLNVLENRISKNKSIIKEDKNKTYLGIT